MSADSTEPGTSRPRKPDTLPQTEAIQELRSVSIADDPMLAQSGQNNRELPALRSLRDGVLKPHATRFASFSLIGASVLVGGLALQAALTSGLHVASFSSYMIQAVISVESSFLLNRRFTWQKARTPFRIAFWRFNAQKAITITAHLILYAGLLKLGVNYLAANVLLTIVFTIVDYLAADRFVFLRRSSAPSMLALSVGADASPVNGDLQTVPVRRLMWGAQSRNGAVSPGLRNEDTTGAAAKFVDGWDYPISEEEILKRARKAMGRAAMLPVGSRGRSIQWGVYDSLMTELHRRRSSTSSQGPEGLPRSH